MTQLSAEREQKLADMGQWVVDTCKLFGAEPETAYKCGALFCAGLRREWTKQREEQTEDDGSTRVV